MTSFFESFFPIFGSVLLGFCARRFNVLDFNQVKGFENFIFKIGLPCYLFSVTLNQKISDIANFSFIFAYLSVFVLTFLFAFLLHLKGSSFKNLISTSLASSYINTALYFTPVVFFLFQNAISGVIANLTQVLVIQTCVITLFMFLEHDKKSKLSVVFKMISTPFVIMPLFGLICNFFDIQRFVFPVFCVTDVIGRATTGLSLFTFGLNCFGLNLFSRQNFLTVLKIVFVKNVMHPIIAFCLGFYVFGLEGYWLKSLVIAATSPTAFLVYIVCNQYNAKSNSVNDSIRTAIVLSSLTSLIVIFVLVFFL